MAETTVDLYRRLIESLGPGETAGGRASGVLGLLPGLSLIAGLVAPVAAASSAGSLGSGSTSSLLPALLGALGPGAGEAPAGGGGGFVSALRNGGGGLGLLSPVLSLISLFAGGGEETATPAALATRFELPAAIRLTTQTSDTGLATGVDFDQRGLPRASAMAAPSQPLVNIQVSAMDSRSFLDRSEDIARAVREALLNGDGLRDLMKEL